METCKIIFIKCLLCNFNLNEPDEVREHYIAFHKADPKNNLRKFFRKLETFFMERGVSDVSSFYRRVSLK